MKLVKTFGDSIEFKLDGIRTVTITSEGIVLDDSSADRLGKLLAVEVIAIEAQDIPEAPVEVSPSETIEVSVEVEAPTETPVHEAVVDIAASDEPTKKRTRKGLLSEETITE